MGDTASTTTVALIGDSHAAMWTPAFQQIATERHWRLQMMAKEACAVVDARTGGVFSHLVEDLQHCQQWRDEILARLAAEHPRLVVVSVWRGYGIDETMSGFRAYDKAWLDGMTQLVRQLRDMGTHGAGARADHRARMPMCRSACPAIWTMLRPARCPGRRRWTNPVSAAEAAATTAGGGQYADLSDLFCTAERCPVIVGNTLGLPRRESPDPAILAGAGSGHRAR